MAYKPKVLTTAEGGTGLSAPGSNGNILTSNGTIWTSAAPAAGATDVTSTSTLTDNAVIRGDGGSRGVQTSTMLITDAGEMTNPSQPAFFAYMSASRTDVTGDGTVYTLVLDTEIYDQNSDFNTSTYTFTAPVTGKYAFAGCITYASASTASSVSDIFVSSNRTLYGGFHTGVVADAGGSLAFASAYQVDMDANDTVVFQAYAAGTTKTVDITSNGATDPRTWFAGYLIC